MSCVLVDSNVLLDVLTNDPQWSAWSGARLDACTARGALAINPVIYAEVSVSFERMTRPFPTRNQATCNGQHFER